MDADLAKHRPVLVFDMRRDRHGQLRADREGAEGRSHRPVGTIVVEKTADDKVKAVEAAQNLQSVGQILAIKAFGGMEDRELGDVREEYRAGQNGRAYGREVGCEYG